MSAVASPPLGGTRALLQSLAPSLVPSERRVVQFCVDQPGRVATMSVADLASVVDVSPATVVRACKSVGLRGFQQLRELLIRDGAVLPPAHIAHLPLHVTRHPVQRMFERVIHGIRGALGALDLDAFDAAAESIRNCNRLLLVGNGASLPAAQSAALRFLTSGRVCESPVDIVTQHIAAKLLKPGDVCLAVSDSGMNRFTLRSARLASEGGATVIAITSYGKSEIVELADYALVAGADFHTWNDGAITGNIVQVLLLSALHSASVSTSDDAKAAHAETMEEVRTIISTRV